MVTLKRPAATKRPAAEMSRKTACATAAKSSPWKLVRPQAYHSSRHAYKKECAEAGLPLDEDEMRSRISAAIEEARAKFDAMRS